MTTATTKPIGFLHAENTDWIKRIEFYRLETTTLESRLKDAVGLLNSKEALAKVEHFQNQIIIQKEQMDELNHAIKDHQNYLENRINENPTASDHRSSMDHPVLRSKMETFEKLYNDMRREFYAFLAAELK